MSSVEKTGEIPQFPEFKELLDMETKFSAEAGYLLKLLRQQQATGTIDNIKGKVLSVVKVFQKSETPETFINAIERYAHNAAETMIKASQVKINYAITAYHGKSATAQQKKKWENIWASEIEEKQRDHFKSSVELMKKDPENMDFCSMLLYQINGEIYDHMKQQRRILFKIKEDSDVIKNKTSDEEVDWDAEMKKFF